MNRVILLGDSIRMGYQATVTAELGDGWEVISPRENGGTTRRTLSYFDEWAVKPALAAAEAGQRVLLHLNCGLHDLGHKREDQDQAIADSPDVPLDAYRQNVQMLLRRAIDEAGLEPGRIIWATTTPVDDEAHNTLKPFCRFNRDVNAYNQAACKVVAALGGRVNDLYALVEEAGAASLMTEDGVHYTDAGSTLLGKAVASAIRAASPGR